MIIQVERWMIATIAITFGLYHSILGLASLHLYKAVEGPLAAIVLFIIALLATVLLYKDIKLPLTHALVVGVIALVMAPLTNPHIIGRSYTSYATWYIGGLGVLLTALIVRRQALIAWFVAAGVFTEVVIWAQGPSSTAIAESGLLGGFLALMAAGQAVSLGVETAAARAQALADQTAAENAAAIATSVRRSERQLRANAALEASRPILERIVQSEGRLTEAQKEEARLAEVELRDEIRGRNLINTKVRAAARAARERGVEVVFLDEGGLDLVDAIDRDRLLGDVANALDGVQSGKVTVRAPKGEDWMITVVAVEPNASAPSLWLRLGSNQN